MSDDDDVPLRTGEIAARDVESTGKAFAAEYYDAFTRAERARFYDDRSKYVLLRFGRGPDVTARGADRIERLAVRMRYHECTLTVKSVDAIQVRPGWLAVLAVGELMRPAEPTGPRAFVQSTVVRYAPSAAAAAKKFVVVGTVFMFDDKIAVVPAPEPEPHVPSVDTTVIVTDDDTATGLLTTTGAADQLHVEKCEKQPTAPVEKKQARVDGGKKPHEQVKIREKLKTAQKQTTEGQQRPAAVNITLKSLSGNLIEDKQVPDVPGESEINLKPPAEKQPFQLKNPPSKESINIQLIDEFKTNVDDNAVLTTTDSKTKQKSTKKKKSTVAAEEIPASTIGGKPKASKEHVSVIGTSKDSSSKKKKKKGPVKDGSPVVSVAAELYVGRLSELVETDQLNETFGKFGKLISTNIFSPAKSKGQLERRNYGIIQYENSETVDVVASYGTVVLENGETVIVEKSKKKSHAT